MRLILYLGKGGVGKTTLAAATAARAAQLLEVFGPALDHPSLPGFPEDRYLKALLLRLA